jgi:hypothetical protein
MWQQSNNSSSIFLIKTYRYIFSFEDLIAKIINQDCNLIDKTFKNFKFKQDLVVRYIFCFSRLGRIPSAATRENSGVALLGSRLHGFVFVGLIMSQSYINNATATDWKLRNQLTEGRGENQLDYDPMNHGSVQDSHQSALSTYSRKFISVAKSP